MGFTTPAFIRKNTPNLRNKLEVLGYLFIPNGWNEWSIPIENCEYLLCDTDTYQGNPISYYIGKDIMTLLECDTIYFLNGWEKSRGCLLEYSAAKIYNKEMMFEKTDKYYVD